MKIGIDARLYDEAGNGRYIRNLILHLQKIDTQNKYNIFLLKKNFDKVDFNNNFTKILADIRWYGFKEQTQLLSLLNKHNLDLVHFPHFNIPVFYKEKFVVTLHDLIHQHFGMEKSSTHGRLIYSLKKWGYNLTFKHAIEKSKKIITVSNFVKQQLINEWQIDNKKIEVIYEAAEENIINLSNKITQTKIHQIMEILDICDTFIFYVGNAHPHKNVDGLIEAFLKLKNNIPKLTLVLAGKDHYFWQRIKSKYQDKDIKYVGFVSDEQLVALYKRAACYVIPSFEEGFGIPLLEAFSCGCPVAASDIKALREIGKDAAIFFDPKDVNNMAQTIKRLLDNSKLRNQLIEKGKNRCKEFSWERLAEQTKEVYASCLGS